MTPTTIPILPSPDFDETAGFYGPLGFAEDSRWPEEYLILRHPLGIELHFWWHPALDAAHNDAGCYVRFPTAVAAQALYDEWASTGLDGDHLRPPTDPGYNLLEFALLDRHRNSIRVGGLIEPPS